MTGPSVVHHEASSEDPSQINVLIEHLRTLGLTRDEASVYLHLLRSGPGKASDIAARVRLRRTEAYRILQNMVQRGQVASTFGRPTTFSAAPPADLFRQVFASQEATWEALAKIRHEVEDVLVRLHQAGEQAEAVAPKASYKVLQGRPDALRFLERLVTLARSEVMLAVSHPHPGPDILGSTAWDVLQRRSVEGLTVQALLGAPSERAPALLGPQSTLRRLASGPPLRLALFDNQAVLLWVVTDSSSRTNAEGDVVLWSDAPEFVANQRALFDALWAQTSA